MDPIDYIKSEIERRGLKQSDLVSAFGSRGKVSEVLNRKRWLSVAMIRDLHFDFGMDATILLRDYKIEDA